MLLSCSSVGIFVVKPAHPAAPISGVLVERQLSFSSMTFLVDCWVASVLALGRAEGPGGGGGGGKEHPRAGAEVLFKEEGPSSCCFGMFCRGCNDYLSHFRAGRERER